MGFLNDSIYAKIRKQIIQDFPEIEMMMEDQGSRSAQYYRMKTFGCNCLELTESCIGVYLTVPPGYGIRLLNNKCKITRRDVTYDSFTRVKLFHKRNLDKNWTYDDLKECVRKMLVFQKKVANYLSLLNYKISVEGVKEVYFNFSEL